MPIEPPSPGVYFGRYSVTLDLRNTEVLDQSQIVVQISIHEQEGKSITNPEIGAYVDGIVQQLVDELNGLRDFKLVNAQKEYEQARAVVTPTPPAE